MRKTTGLTLLAFVVITFCFYAVHQYHNYTDIIAAKNMVLTCKSRAIAMSVEDGLLALAGTDGSVDWCNSEISTLGDSHVSEVEAVVVYKDSTGNVNKATYCFHINHDNGSKYLDYFDHNGKAGDVKEGKKLILSTITNRS